jgi:hypothetical protein
MNGEVDRVFCALAPAGASVIRTGRRYASNRVRAVVNLIFFMRCPILLIHVLTAEGNLADAENSRPPLLTVHATK